MVFVDYDSDAEYVLIMKALKHDSPANPNQVKAAMQQVETLPKTRLLAGLLTVTERYSKLLGERLWEWFENGYHDFSPVSVCVPDDTPPRRRSTPCQASGTYIMPIAR